MPTILIFKGYRFFFYINDHEPPHVHLEKDNKTAKYSLEPINLVLSKGFNNSELKKIKAITEANVELFKQKWNECFKR